MTDDNSEEFFEANEDESLDAPYLISKEHPDGTVNLRFRGIDVARRIKRHDAERMIAARDKLISALRLPLSG